MNFSLYIDYAKPAVAAAILRERALLQTQGKVYVKGYTRSWPGGMVGAVRAMRKAKKYRRRVVYAAHRRAA